jgi:acetyl esterase/lipase
MDEKNTVSLPRPTAVAYGDHPSQFVDVYRPEGAGPRPVVVLIHGGFWRLPWGRDLMLGLASDLVGRGFAAVNVEYRRLGEDGGGWPGTCEDLVSALGVLAGRGERAGRADVDRSTAGLNLDLDLDLDLSRVGLVGHSAGGHLALWAAKHAPLPLRIVVSQSGVLDLRSAARDRLDGNADGRLPAAIEFVGGEPDDADFDAAYSLASPIELLPLGPAVHQFVLHGDADNRVPFQQSVDYVAAAEAAGDSVELAAFTGMGHFEVIDAAHESWLRVADELTRRLGA